MKKHCNGAAAPREASPVGQKMSLVPHTVLLFPALSTSGGRRGGHSMMRISGGHPKGDVEACGGTESGARVGWSRDAVVGSPGHSPGHRPHQCLEFICSCKHSYRSSSYLSCVLPTKSFADKGQCNKLRPFQEAGQ